MWAETIQELDDIYKLDQENIYFIRKSSSNTGFSCYTLTLCKVSMMF